MIKICVVAGARPNFMKIAPIIDAINNHNQSNKQSIRYLIVHTGQHYDQKMSKLFFSDLGIPNPDINLEVGSASHAVQTAEIMKKFEDVCLIHNPTHVLVVGDVNSTIACALVASKLNIKVVHVEAGLRSFDRTMPEEINRVLTDAISDLLFVTEKSAEENLIKEGIPKDKIYIVGNVMIDTLLKHKQEAEQSSVLNELGLINKEFNDRNQSIKRRGKMSNLRREHIDYALLTLHRPSNVDNKHTFLEIIEALKEISRELPIIFPAHPRTLNCIKQFGYEDYFNFVVEKLQLKISKDRINCIEPLGYLDFLHLISNSRLVLTDSGGIQEETTILGIPCITIRDNTERPITVTHGTNKVVGTKKISIINEGLKAIRDNKIKPITPPLWDGKAAKRIVDILLKTM